MNIQTLKGFRDFLSLEARKRQYVTDILKKVFESYGFEPLVTPTLEYDELLTGKYGEEGEKLMYRFEDNGGRKVALRYDQTVPTARVVAQYENVLPIPYKRYQMQNVFRADNTQRGRFREFTQCDCDIIGINSPEADAEIIATVYSSLKELGFPTIKILVNDRVVFAGMSSKTIAIIDKLKKIGKEGVCKELVEKRISPSQSAAENLLDSILKSKMTQRLEKIFMVLEELGVPKTSFEFSPTLARGLDYYTGMIFEVEIPEYTVGSVAGGGRFDELIGMFAGKKIEATGFSIGFDRILDAMEQLNLFPTDVTRASAKVLVSVFNTQLEEEALKISAKLRGKNIPTELWLDANTKIDKQLKYADNKGIPYVIVLGPEEIEKNVVTFKNLSTREQKQLPLEQVIKELLQ